MNNPSMPMSTPNIRPIFPLDCSKQSETLFDLSPREFHLILCFRAIDKWFDTLNDDQVQRIAAMPHERRGTFVRRAVSMYVTKGGR